MTRAAVAPTRRIFELALGEILWTRRGAFIALAAAAPVLLATIVRLALIGSSAVFIVNGNRLDAESMLGTVISLLYLRVIVPGLGVFYGTALIADEVEEKTITYLFVRPIPRGAIALGKYLAYLVSTLALVLPSAALVFIVMVPPGQIGQVFGTLVQDLVAIAAGLAAYGALFLWTGIMFRRPLVGGLVFVFGWEPIALVLPGYAERLTIAHYVQAGPAGWASVIVATVALVWLAMQTIERREYVLEQ